MELRNDFDIILYSPMFRHYSLYCNVDMYFKSDDVCGILDNLVDLRSSCGGVQI